MNKRREALRSLKRLWRNLRNGRLKLKTPKHIAAMNTLEGRWERLREKIRSQGYYRLLTATCKIDRLIVTTQKLDLDSLKNMAGVKLTKRRYLPKTSRYKYADTICGTGSIREIVVEHGPRAWGSKYKITIIPADGGLQWEDLFTILELLEDYRLSLAEVAWDFPSDTIFDVQYALKFMLCGKMPLPVGSNPFHQKFGIPRGAVSVRLYTSFTTFATRLEVQLQRRFFREHGIESVFDFHKFPELVLPHYVWFAGLDKKKTLRQLKLNGFGKKKRRRIMEQLQDREHSLWEQLSYLRRRTGLVNTRRLCTALQEENECISKALAAALSVWPTTPRRLEAQ